jgi:RNA polymerase sigma factor (sigma-70 family)
VAEHPDAVLLRMALDGTERARRLMFERIDPLIRARLQICFSNGRPIDIHELDDVAQQVWVHLFDRDNHRLHNFDPQRGSLEQYISVIASHAISDLLRLRKTHLNPVELDDSETEGRSPNPEHVAEMREQAQKLRVFLRERLPIRGQLVLALLYDDGRSDDEAAEIMSVSRQVVANWKHKIKALARDFQKNHQ